MRSRNRLWLVGLLIGGLAILLCVKSYKEDSQPKGMAECAVVQEALKQVIAAECSDTMLQAAQATKEILQKELTAVKKRTSKSAVIKEIQVREVHEEICEVSNEPLIVTDTISIQENALLQDTVVTTVDEEVPLMKAIGRFNRKIENRLLVKKHGWMGGLTFTWAEYNSDDTEFLSLIKDFNCKANMLSINPFVGYFYKDNACLGIKFGFERVSASLGGLNIDIDDDMSFGLSDMAFKQEMLRATLFHRSYVGLDKSHRFGLFNETALSFNTGTSFYERPVTEELKNTSTRIREIQIGFNPGATVFIMENVAAELSFGIAGFKYRQENQTVNGEESGWRKSSGANFKINLLNINIGVVAYL